MKNLIKRNTYKLHNKPALIKPVIIHHFNLNDEVIIYPNEKGWQKIIELTAKNYKFSTEKAIEWTDKRKTEDDGYKEQLWVIISDLHDMFYNGQNYMQTTYCLFINDNIYLNLQSY